MSANETSPFAALPSARINVSESERWASVIFGGMLTLFGVQRRSLGGALLAASGASLIYRGVTGHCATYEALGVDTASGERFGDDDLLDTVEESSLESFPASDPPSWTPTSGTGNPNG